MDMNMVAVEQNFIIVISLVHNSKMLSLVPQSSIIAILQEQDLSVVICEELNLKEMNLK